MVRILRAGGMTVQPHDTHFPATPPGDPEWLQFVGERRWIGISADKEMSLSDLAMRSLMTYQAKAFICIGAGKHGFRKMAENVVNSQHSMEQFIHKHRRIAFVARLYMAPPEQFKIGRAGPIKMYLTHAEWQEREKRRHA